MKLGVLCLLGLPREAILAMCRADRHSHQNFYAIYYCALPCLLDELIGTGQVPFAGCRVSAAVRLVHVSFSSINVCVHALGLPLAVQHIDHILGTGCGGYIQFHQLAILDSSFHSRLVRCMQFKLSIPVLRPRRCYKYLFPVRL